MSGWKEEVEEHVTRMDAERLVKISDNTPDPRQENRKI
jgi:hypothetical protein